MSSLFYVENLVKGILQKGTWYITIKTLTGLLCVHTYLVPYDRPNCSGCITLFCTSDQLTLQYKILYVLPKTIQRNSI